MYMTWRYNKDRGFLETRDVKDICVDDHCKCCGYFGGDDHPLKGQQITWTESKKTK